MRPQPNRMPEDTPKGFAGSAIDRSHPVRFRLDGRIVSGFAGDTVLSAVLASGIDTMGQLQHSPIGLTQRANPAISHASLANDPQRALPMARTPAQDGAEFVTIGADRPRGLARLLQPGRTLGLSLDAASALDRPWRTMQGSPNHSTDLLVIGGGVAGLSAALAAARAGLKVILAEASPLLGGQSGLFGTQEGEDGPEESMARLGAEVSAHDAITVLTATHVFAIRTGLARAHRVEPVNGTSQGSVIDIRAPRIVIATGALERLPLFAGNRLPGVIGTLEAYELAARYGIWSGRRAVLATSNNHAYRLAMLANDAGMDVDRIFDARPHSASRFIEFSRAYGIVQSPGTIVSSVDIARNGGTLTIRIERKDAAPIVTERVLVCGGWQPDLTLWHVAGGTSHWHHSHNRLEATGTLDAIALAGSAAGYFTRRGCIQSGADAVDQLLARPRRPVDDPVVDPLYETPDGRAAIAAVLPTRIPAYLDGGTRFLQRPGIPAKPLVWRWRRARPQGLHALSEVPQPLAVNEVAAGVDLDLIPPPAAGIVAQERVALIPLADGPAPAPGLEDQPIAEDEVPHYLRDRFGAGARVVRLAPAEQRMVETGALIFRSSDESHPLAAIGVVLRSVGNTAIAVVAAQAATGALVIRDKGQIVRASVVS